MTDSTPPVEVPEPDWIIKGNRVGCKYCGLKLKTRAKYVSHFMKRHMNEDGTWRSAEHRFDPIKDVTEDELEAVEYDETGGKRPKRELDMWGIDRSSLDRELKRR